MIYSMNDYYPDHFEEVRKENEEAKKEKQRKLHVTNIEKEAWKVSDVLSKTIKFLYKTDLSDSVREKMIRDIVKDNLVNFYKKQSNTKETEEVREFNK
jgi:hypothetical protein